MSLAQSAGKRMRVSHNWTEKWREFFKPIIALQSRLLFKRKPLSEVKPKAILTNSTCFSASRVSKIYIFTSIDWCIGLRAVFFVNGQSDYFGLGFATRN